MLYGSDRLFSLCCKGSGSMLMAMMSGAPFKAWTFGLAVSSEHENIMRFPGHFTE
jgi:hypothetical protein